MNRLSRCHLAVSALLLAMAGACAVLGGCNSGNSPQAMISKWSEDMFPPPPSEVARDAFNVSDPDKRRKSVNLLSNAPWGGEDPYLNTYRLLVDDPDPTVRAASLRALGKHGEPRDTAAIIPYLKDKANFVRWEAAMALQRLHDPAAVEPLINTLRDDEDPDVRAAAANALGQYPEDRVFQALIGSLIDDDYAVVNESETALGTLTGQSLGQEGAAWLAWAKGRDDLFSDRKPYFYPQYVKPRGFIDKVQVWKEPKEVTPTQPRGTPTDELVTKPADDDLNDDLTGKPGPG